MVKFVMLCSQRVDDRFWLLSFNFLNQWFPINVSSVRDNKLKNQSVKQNRLQESQIPWLIFLNSSQQSQDTFSQIN